MRKLWRRIKNLMYDIQTLDELDVNIRELTSEERENLLKELKQMVKAKEIKPSQYYILRVKNGRTKDN